MTVVKRNKRAKPDPELLTNQQGRSRQPDKLMPGAWYT
jgi:hypothetical protein